jgi:hypothetical protein
MLNPLTLYNNNNHNNNNKNCIYIEGYHSVVGVLEWLVF